MRNDNKIYSSVDLKLYCLAKYGYFCFCLTELVVFFFNLNSYSLPFCLTLFLPLLLPFQGILKNNLYTYSWAGYIFCFYSARSLVSLLLESELILILFYLFQFCLILLIFFATCFLVKKHSVAARGDGYADRS